MLNATVGLADADILAISTQLRDSKWSPGGRNAVVKADKKPIKNLELIQEIDRTCRGASSPSNGSREAIRQRAPMMRRAPCAEAYRDAAIFHGPGLLRLKVPIRRWGIRYRHGSVEYGRHWAAQRRNWALPHRADAASAGSEIPGNATEVETPEEALERQFLEALRRRLSALKALEPYAYASGTTVLLPRVWKDAH